MMWIQSLIVLAILMVAVVYGTDMFFAVIGRPALAHSSARGITDVMGHLHEVADRRMPIFGAIGMVCTLGLALISQGSTMVLFAAVAFIAQLVYLALYFRISKPINATLTAAANRGESLDDAVQLQRRWDAAIYPRALAMGIALLSLLLIALRA